MSTIFVFGSNLLGMHGAGAALAAKKAFGAIRGQGEGLQGQSYAIPTKATPWVKLSLSEVKVYVDRFLWFARTHEDLKFLVTRVGCGRAGFNDRQMAPLFKGAPSNCELPEEWRMLNGHV
jgi:hypothetical protein